MNNIEHNKIMMAVTLVEEAEKGNIPWESVTTEELEMVNEWYDEEIKRKIKYLDLLKEGGE